jgi:methionine synthase II (cobalamin-independent)
MPEGSNQIKTTHVGSLIRPDDIVDGMRKIFRGEEIDLQAHNARLTEAVREVVRRQREAGIDIVSDGEFGKIGWNFYVYERLGGIELRPPQNDTFGDMPIRATDWERFPEFYAEYFRAEQDFETPSGVFAAVTPSATPVRRRSGATSPTSRRRWKPRASPRASCPWSRPPAASRA